MSTPPETQVIVDTAIAAAGPKPLDTDGRFFSLVIPKDDERFIIDLEAEREHLLDRPRRKTGKVLVRDAASFLTYYDKHHTMDTEVWANIENQTITAVINAHGKAYNSETGDTTAIGDAGHGDHRATLQLRLTPAWQAWVAKNKLMLKQVDFAEHIEDRLTDIKAPTGAEMLELAQSFQAKRAVTFESSKALSTGQVELEYRETIDAKAGQKGRLSIPQTFDLAIAPFEGSPAYKVTARLRYRINGGDLQLGYTLDRPEDILDAAFSDVLDQVQAGVGTPIMRGAPAS